MAYDADERYQMTNGAGATRVVGATVTADYFSVLGVGATLGRVFSPGQDDIEGAPPVAVLSDRLWRTRFAGAPATVGRGLMLNGVRFTVVGVAPRDFRGPNLEHRPDLWIPRTAQRQVAGAEAYAGLVGGKASWLEMMGRLRPGVTLEAAQAVVDVRAPCRSRKTAPRCATRAIRQPSSRPRRRGSPTAHAVVRSGSAGSSW
jgi:hypothetical protein